MEKINFEGAGFRHEIKHTINYVDYLTLHSRLSRIAKTDSHADETGEYFIRSLYFDDDNDKALNEKLIGINHRSKFRLRFYNNDSSFIHIEKKSKINGLCQKQSSRITKAECEMLFAGDFSFLKEGNDNLRQELYIRMTSERLRPKTIVDYDREAYVYPPGNVRVTFDKNVKTGLFSTDFFEPELPSIKTFGSNLIILEVKFDEFLPDLITDLLQLGSRRPNPVSKYALCRGYGNLI